MANDIKLSAGQLWRSKSGLEISIGDQEVTRVNREFLLGNSWLLTLSEDALCELIAAGNMVLVEQPTPE